MEKTHGNVLKTHGSAFYLAINVQYLMKNSRKKWIK